MNEPELVLATISFFDAAKGFGFATITKSVPSGSMMSGRMYFHCKDHYLVTGTFPELSFSKATARLKDLSYKPRVNPEPGNEIVAIATQGKLSLVATQWGQLADPGALIEIITTKGLRAYIRKDVDCMLGGANPPLLFKGNMSKFLLDQDNASLSLFFRNFQQLQAATGLRITLLPDMEAKLTFNIRDVRFVPYRHGSATRFVLLRPDRTPPLGPMVSMKFSKRPKIVQE